MTSIHTQLRGRRVRPIGRTGRALEQDAHPPLYHEDAATLRWTWAVGLAGVLLLAFGVRALLVGQQSAYMDEGAQILIGRTLLEQGKSYGDAIVWNYGSYAWPLVAGSADTLAGLVGVRVVTALLGAGMVAATAVFTLRLTPHLDPTRRQAVSLIAALLMALMPTAIGIGRFGTYDALAMSAFMGSVALLLPLRPNASRLTLLGGMVLLLVAFLAKYVVAVFLPVICLYLIFGPRNRRDGVRNLTWVVLPLTAACAIYFVAFRASLLELLAFSTQYRDLRSPTPLREYLWLRPDIIVLGLIAACGWPLASRQARLLTLSGVTIMALFILLTRADYDYWKHSVYLTFFFAPLAALAALRAVELVTSLVVAAFGWRQRTGTEQVVGLLVVAAALALQARLWPDTGLWRPAMIAAAVVAPLAGMAALALARRYARGPRWRPMVVSLAVGLLAPLPVVQGLAHADTLVTFYPNLNPSVRTIRADTASARRILTDDTVVRYYLYNQIAADAVVDPFYFTYTDATGEGTSGPEAYRRALRDRYFDALVLDGGIGPIAGRLASDNADLIESRYQLISEIPAGNGKTLRTYQPRERVASSRPPPAPNARIYRFGEGVQGWGARPAPATVTPGLQVTVTDERTLNGQPTLRFDALPNSPLLGVAYTGSAARITAQVYLAADSAQQPPVQVGMFSFDQTWQYRDDGFRQQILPGRWTEITWDARQPGRLREIGINFDAKYPLTVYLGEVIVDP